MKINDDPDLIDQDFNKALKLIKRNVNSHLTKQIEQMGIERTTDIIIKKIVILTTMNRFPDEYKQDRWTTPRFWLTLSSKTEDYLDSKINENQLALEFVLTTPNPYHDLPVVVDTGNNGKIGSLPPGTRVN